MHRLALTSHGQKTRESVVCETGKDASMDVGFTMRGDMSSGQGTPEFVGASTSGFRFPISLAMAELEGGGQ